MGGLVTSHHAGMSVPDWPNSYGYNMFLFPPNQWVGGILYEHTHRLMATVVGFLSVVLVLWAWGPAVKPNVRRWIGACALLAGIAAGLFAAGAAFGRHSTSATFRELNQGAVTAAGVALVLLSAYFARHPEPRRWVRWLCAGILGVVLLQGLLGGLRVVLVNLDLAIVHACLAQAFFCLATLAAIVTSRWWKSPSLSSPSSDLRRIAWLGIATVSLVYLQLIVGALMRHFDAGLAIPDLPLAYGKWLPPLTADGLAAINHKRAFTLNLDPVTLSQVWLHFGHRIGAVLVSGFAVTFACLVLRRRQNRLVLPALALIGLIATQVTLGVLTVLLRKPADVASAHVAVGALVLVTSFLLTVRLLRINRGQLKTVAQHREPLSAGNRRSVGELLVTG